MDYKQIIVDSLDILRKRDISNKEIFKARAYGKVLTQIKNLDTPIRSYEDVLNINGIGEKISEKIKEILETGMLESANKAKKLYNLDALDAFQNIYGVGPNKANELIKMGFTTIEDLKTEIKSNPKLLNDKQKIGLKYYEDLLERIPHHEIIEHSDILYSLLLDEMEEYKLEVVGSFRRKADTSGDIDVLIRVPPNTHSSDATNMLDLYVKMLEGFGYIKEILALGDKKCMAISAIYNGRPRRLDLLMTPYDEYAYALLYFTGSDRFNVAFRQYALNVGYSLNERGLTKMGLDVKDVPIMRTEKDIFTFLGLRYIEPVMRIDHNQIIPIKSRPKIALHN